MGTQLPTPNPKGAPLEVPQQGYSMAALPYQIVLAANPSLVETSVPTEDFRCRVSGSNKKILKNHPS